MRILYVEDNQANLFLVQRVARMGGHEVITYTNGENALANFDTDQPHLILMDVQLSGELSGLDVTKRLRAAGHKTPIVAVTAYAMVGDRERCMQAGCDGYLSKPLPITELVEIIKKYETAAVTAAPAAPVTEDAVPAAPPAPVPPPAQATVSVEPAAPPSADAAVTPAPASDAPVAKAAEEATQPAPPDAKPAGKSVTV